MIKKVLLGVLAYIIGIGIGVYFESFFRETIQDIFKFTTSNKIQFRGKNIYFSIGGIFKYILSFTLMLFLFSNLNLKLKQVIKNTVILLLIFGISLFVISAINANLKVIECTACDNGIVRIHWNGINYDLIIGLSAILAIIPSIIRLVKHKLKKTP